MKKSDERITMIHSQQVVGMLYQVAPLGKNKKAIIYLKGGPSLGDDGHSPTWPAAKKHGFDLFVPDYIGYCRSEGEFSFNSCVQTIYESYDFLTGKQGGIMVEEGTDISLDYEEIVLVGSSWGGAIAPFCELWRQTSIQTIILIKPVTDWVAQHSTPLVAGRMDHHHRVITDGWLDFYRGYAGSDWERMFCDPTFDMTAYNPIENMELLQGKRVIVCHGKKDDGVEWKQSQTYVIALKRKGTAVQGIFDPQGDHGSEYTASALESALKLL